MALIKCDECGADVSDKATACPKCGNPIHATTSFIPASSTSSSTGAPLEPAKPKPSTSRKLAGAVAVFFVAVIAFMVFEGKSSDKQSDNTIAAVNNAAPPSQDPNPATADAVSEASAQASAAAAQEADQKCAVDLQCTGDKYSITANSQCEVMIEDHAREIAKWDYKVDTDHWYTPFTSKFSWGGSSHRRVIYYGDQAKFQNGFGAWQRQPYWCVFDIASQKVTAAQFDIEGLPPLDEATTNDQPVVPDNSAPSTLLGANNNQAAPAAPPPGQVTQSIPASQPVATLAASFDCTKAHSTSEMLICGDPKLAELDKNLAMLYAQAKAAAPDKQVFANTTRQNWNWREQNCRDKACLVSWYADQNQRFMDIIAKATDPNATKNEPSNQAQQNGDASGRPATYQTSFDCSAPTYLDEKAVCGDPGLAAMDVEMATEYAAALKRTADPTKLESDQNDWHAVRRDCASDLNCLRHSYGVRIDQLRRWQG